MYSTSQLNPTIWSNSKTQFSLAMQFNLTRRAVAELRSSSLNWIAELNWTAESNWIVELNFIESWNCMELSNDWTTHIYIYIYIKVQYIYLYIYIYINMICIFIHIMTFILQVYIFVYYNNIYCLGSLAGIIFLFLYVYSTRQFNPTIRSNSKTQFNLAMQFILTRRAVAELRSSSLNWIAE